MINGVEALIGVEQKLEGGADIKGAMGEHADLLGGGHGCPKYSDKHKCLVRKFVNEENYSRLSKLKTTKGFDLDYALKAGIQLAHLGVGIVNDGVESLNMFKEIYNPVVEGWHGFKPEQNHKSDMDPSHISKFTITVETINKYVASTRVRAGRSVNGLSLPAFTDEKDRAKVEELLQAGFASLEGDLKGTYYSLGSMNEEMAT